MRFGYRSDRRSVMQGLEKSIGIRVENIRFETGEIGVIIETTVSYSAFKRNLPKVKILDTKLGVLDLNFTEMFRNLSSRCLRSAQKTSRLTSSSKSTDIDCRFRSFSLLKRGALSLLV